MPLIVRPELDQEGFGSRLARVLEIVFTSLLVGVSLLVGGFAVLTIYKLFSGQA